MYLALYYGSKVLPTNVPDTLLWWYSTADKCSRHFAMVEKICRQLFRILYYRWVLRKQMFPAPLHGSQVAPTIVPNTSPWSDSPDTNVPYALLWC